MKRVYCFFIIVVVLLIQLFCTNSIVTYNKEVFADNTSGKVSDRELAIASALSYLPPPLNCKFNSTCKFGDRIQLVDKFNQFVNLHNYATTDELDDWSIVDYTEKKTTIANFSAIFNAYTLKNNDNVMIVFRGTDFTDLLEWLQHSSYLKTDIHSQESYAEEYILQQAKKYKDCNIYITGHSLGGYLTQIAAATLEKAIQNGKTNSTDWDGFNLSKNKYNLESITKDFSEYKNINFVQAVSYNGMGLVFNYNSPVNDQNEKIKILKNLGKNIYSEPRLINYKVKGDIVSSIGISYGEVRVVDAALDSVSYHKKNYKFLSPLNTINILERLINYNTNLNNYVENHFQEDIIEDYKYYGMNSVIGYLNLTHEIDEYACLLNGKQSPYVKIVEEKPWLLSTQASLIKSYIKGEQLDEIISNKEITATLRAMTYEGCARKYVWFACTSSSKTGCVIVKNNKFDKNANNFNNKNNILDLSAKKGTDKYYFVRSYYNDNYYKTTLKDEINHEYNQKAFVKNHENYVDSNLIHVLSDAEIPKCNFNQSTVNVRLKQNLFTYEDSTDKVTITCVDNKSGFDVRKKNYKQSFYTSDVGLLPSIKISKINTVSVTKNKIVIDIYVTSTRVPLYLTPQLRFDGGIKDIAGNNADSSSVVFNIRKA